MVGYLSYFPHPHLFHHMILSCIITLTGLSVESRRFPVVSYLFVLSCSDFSYHWLLDTIYCTSIAHVVPLPNVLSHGQRIITHRNLRSTILYPDSEYIFRWNRKYNLQMIFLYTAPAEDLRKERGPRHERHFNLCTYWVY